MKHKIFLILIAFLFVFGGMALADYIEPTTVNSNNTAPNNTMSSVLKVDGTGSTITTYEKVAVWEGTPLTSTKDINALLKSGSYAGDATHTKGGFAEKLVSQGATRFLGSDLLTRVEDNSNNTPFDQYSNTIKYYYQSIEKTAKPLQGIIAGRMLGNISITNDINLAGNTNANPTYSLDFLATNKDTSTYFPTTNIGLGDSCNLYTTDIGTTIGSGGGCPAGSYISYYKAPSFSGTLSSTNNTNTQTVATCVKFNPSTNPTNTGRCSTGRDLSSAVTASFGSPIPDDCHLATPSNCTASSWYYKATGNNYWTPGLPSGVSGSDKCSKYSGYTFAFDGQCTSCTFGCPWNNVSQQIGSIATDTTKCINTVSVNNGIFKMPSTLSGNIKWYNDVGTWINYNNFNDKTSVEGCNGTVAKVTVTDLYGQFVEKLK